MDLSLSKDGKVVGVKNELYFAASDVLKNTLETQGGFSTSHHESDLLVRRIGFTLGVHFMIYKI
jgi:hypothetical protein